MIDREKVINGLDCCSANPSDCDICQYYGYKDADGDYPNCREKMMIDALALLKEQEAVEPILIREGRNKNYNDYVCPRCYNEVAYEQNYCSECGVRFLWEGR